MANSEVDICNLALAHLGKQPIASLTEESVERRICFRFYDQALDELIERSDWSFAQKIAFLAQRPDADNPYSMRYAHWYDLPNDLVRPVRLLHQPAAEALGPVEDRTDSAFINYELIGGNLFTNADKARLLYVYELRDPTQFSPSFTSALAFLIARYAAIPLTRSDRIAAAVERSSEVMFARAVAGDAAGEPDTYIRQPGMLTDRYFDVPGIGEDP